MPALYELATAYQSLQQLIEDGDDNDWTQALESLQGSIAEKCENIARVIRSIESDGDAYEAESKRLSEKARSTKNASARLKDYLKGNMEVLGLDKVKGGLFTVALQNNPPACQIVDEEAIPTAYKTLIPAQYITDKRRIVEAWKVGELVPGVTVVQGKHVRIR